jgi:hypothetical protein
MFRLPSCCGLVLALALAGVCPRTHAAEALSDRTPKRELTTDRPDATESPFTVEPGHVQLEMDFANFGRDRAAGTRATEWEVAPFNLRFGLAADLEAGFFMIPFRREREQPPTGPATRQHGFGDVMLRTKLNLWGNDGGTTAFGAIADLKLPTGSGGLGNGKFEGAMTFPLAFSLAGDWSGGAMTSMALVHDGVSYQAVWGNTLTFGHDITADVGGFVELTSEAGSGAHVATFNCGLTRAFGRNTQLDCGINVGLSRSAPDFQLFAGLSQRF